MSSELIPYSVYTFTRIIVDHSKPVHSSLKDKEVRFCVEVIREKFADCRTIGRDFVRLLQDLTKIPQFSDLWKDILQRPQSLSSQFTDLTQLFATRTPRKFLQSRVTPDMEKLLLFIMQKVIINNILDFIWINIDFIIFRLLWETKKDINNGSLKRI